MRAIFVGLLCMFLATTAYAESWQKVGEETYSFLFMDVYTSTLETPSGQYVRGEAARLTNMYHMNFSGEELYASTREELVRVSGESEAVIDGWLEQLKGKYPNIKDGENIRATFDGKETMVLNHNGSDFVTLKGRDFALAFFDIWLSDKSRSSSFTEALLGE